MTVAVTRDWEDGQGRAGTMLYMWCPGCEALHGVEVNAADYRWQWDGNLAAPTISPSILVTTYSHVTTRRCHSYVKSGVWEFLADCDHCLASRRVPLPELPAWLLC